MAMIDSAKAQDVDALLRLNLALHDAQENLLGHVLNGNASPADARHVIAVQDALDMASFAFTQRYCGSFAWVHCAGTHVVTNNIDALVRHRGESEDVL